MKGLLLRDFYVLKRSALSLVMICVVYAILAAVQKNNSFFVWFLGLLAGMTPMTVIGLDERSKWEVLAGTMPYTRTEIVISKYLLSLISLCFAIILFTASSMLMMSYKGGIEFDTVIFNILLMSFVGILFSAVEFPFVFWLGATKGRIVVVVLAMVISMLGSVFAISSGLIGALTEVSVINDILFIGVAAAAAVMAVSAVISIAVYKKKEL